MFELEEKHSLGSAPLSWSVSFIISICCEFNVWHRLVLSGSLIGLPALNIWPMVCTEKPLISFHKITLLNLSESPTPLKIILIDNKLYYLNEHTFRKRTRYFDCLHEYMTSSLNTTLYKNIPQW